MSAQYDVIVVGAGPAGSTTAHFLAQQGAHVLLLDKADFPRDKTCGDGVPPRALPVLDEMGLLDDVRARGFCLDTFAVTSPSGRKTTVPLPVMPHAPSEIYILPRLLLDDLIRERAVRSGAAFVPNAQVTDVRHDDSGATVTATIDGDAGQSFRARMVVIASGAATGLLIMIGALDHPPWRVLAARAYFENIPDLERHFHFVFTDVPMPGYGWVFPTSPTSANVGVGYLVRNGNQPASPAVALNTFVSSPLMQDLCAVLNRSAR